MPLISLADGLAHAREHRYALGAFNVLDSHFLRALFAAAKQERSPFIINIAEVHFKYISLDSLVEAVKFEAARHDIPVVLNLDHGLHFESVVRALRLGFSSVMFDGSTLEYEENIRQTREVVRCATPSAYRWKPNWARWVVMRAARCTAMPTSRCLPTR